MTPVTPAPRYQIRSLWVGWKGTAQTLLWPPEPVTLRAARWLLLFARLRRDRAEANYEVIDSMTGEPIIDPTDLTADALAADDPA